MNGERSRSVGSLLAPRVSRSSAYLFVEALNLPTYDFHVDKQEGRRVVYDPIRQTYVRLTPEEWVRQHFVQYLIQEQGAPAGLVSVEASFRYQGQPRRADIVIYSRQGEPLLLVECKAPRVSIGQDAFDQGAQYNLVLGAPFLVVTNGQTHYACRVDFDARNYAFLDDLPCYEAMQDEVA